MYFREGMTLKKVIAELGYPSEGCLTNWIARDPRHGRRRLSYTLDVKAGPPDASSPGSVAATSPRTLAARRRACGSGPMHTNGKESADS